MKNVYEQTMKNQQVKMEKSEYAQDEPIAAEAKRIINEIALTGWTSGGHSAGGMYRSLPLELSREIPKPD